MHVSVSVAIKTPSIKTVIRYFKSNIEEYRYALSDISSQISKNIDISILSLFQYSILTYSDMSNFEFPG